MSNLEYFKKFVSRLDVEGYDAFMRTCFNQNIPSMHCDVEKCPIREDEDVDPTQSGHCMKCLMEWCNEENNFKFVRDGIEFVVENREDVA